MTLSVELQRVTHSFGDFKALDGIDLAVQPGSIHAIVGENGAGKTTLMRVLYGTLTPQEGTVRIDGEEKHWRNTADAIAHGVGMVSQHYSIIPELTCLQNLILGAEGGPVLNSGHLAGRATDLAKKMGFTFDWEAEASTLSPASAQKLEIVKLLWRESRIMILDEPTAMLSPLDSDALFQSLRQLANEGATVLVVTHRIPEVLQHCDRVTVLRGGRLIANREVGETNKDELAELIVGHTVQEHTSSDFAPGGPVLEVSGLTVLGSRKDEAVKSAGFVIHSGEVVGLAGVDGNGQRELFHVIIGTLPVAKGRISIGGQDLTRASAAQRIRAGLRLIPEDRHEEGVIEDWSLTLNAVLGLQRIPPISRRSRLDLSVGKELVTRVADRFNTKHGGHDRPMRDLSGGNQQRFVAARAFELGPKLILAFQPTRGLDIDGTAQVYAALHDQCRAGAAALVVSFDLDEILEFCDRALVINGGQVSKPTDAQSKDRQAIGRLMVGAS